MESGDIEKQGKKNKTKERRATKKNETKEDSEKRKEYNKRDLRQQHTEGKKKERRGTNRNRVRAFECVCLGSARPASLFYCFVGRCIVCVFYFLLFTATAGVSSLERCIRAVL